MKVKHPILSYHHSNLSWPERLTIVILKSQCPLTSNKNVYILNTFSEKILTEN